MSAGAPTILQGGGLGAIGGPTSLGASGGVLGSLGGALSNLSSSNFGQGFQGGLAGELRTLSGGGDFDFSRLGGALLGGPGGGGPSGFQNLIQGFQMAQRLQQSKTKPSKVISDYLASVLERRQ